MNASLHLLRFAKRVINVKKIYKKTKVALYAIGSMAIVAQSVVPNILLMPNILPSPSIAMAAAEDGYDITVTKTIEDSDNANEGGTIQYRIEYENLDGDAISDVSLSDTWSVGLSNPTLISSMPDISGTRAVDGPNKMWTADTIALAANELGIVIVEFDIDIGVASGTVLTNLVSCDADVESCVPYNSNGSSYSQLEVPVNSLPTANVYDLEIIKAEGKCDLGGGGGAPIGACSISGGACSVDEDCPFGEADICIGGGGGGGGGKGGLGGVWSTLVSLIAPSVQALGGGDLGGGGGGGDAGGTLGNCTDVQGTYASGDSVFFTVAIVNNNITGADSSVDNISFVDWFDPGLEFVGVFNETDPGLVGIPHEGIQSVSFSDGFTLQAGENTTVQLEFIIARDTGKKHLFNYAEVGTNRNDAMGGGIIQYRGDSNSSIGGVQVDPTETHLPSGGGLYTTKLLNDAELTNFNNISQASINLPNYDLSINKVFDGGTLEWGGQLTYTLTFTNDAGLDRDDGQIRIKDIMVPVGTTLVSFTTSPGFDYESGPSINQATPWYWNGVSLDVGETHTITMTVELPTDNSPYCVGDVQNTAEITLHGYQIGANGTSLKDLVEEGNETNVVNNIFTHNPGNLSVPAGNCIGKGYDLSITNQVVSNTANLCPGDIVEYEYTLGHRGIRDKYVQLDNITNPNLHFLDVSAVDYPSRYISFDTISNAYFTDIDTNITAMLTYDSTTQYEEEVVVEYQNGDVTYHGPIEDFCVNGWWADGSISRVLEEGVDAEFKATFDAEYAARISAGDGIDEALIVAYAKGVADAYDWLGQQTVDLLQMSLDNEECQISRLALVYQAKDGNTPALALEAAQTDWLGSYNGSFDLYNVIHNESSQGILYYSRYVDSVQEYLKKFTSYTDALASVNWGTDSATIVEQKIIAGLEAASLINDQTFVDLEAKNHYVTDIVQDCSDSTLGDFTTGCDFWTRSNFLDTYDDQEDYLNNEASPTLLYTYEKNHEVLIQLPGYIQLEGIRDLGDSISPTQKAWSKRTGYLLPAGDGTYVNRTYRVRYVVGSVPDGTTLTNEARISMDCNEEVAGYGCLIAPDGNGYRWASEEIPGSNNTDTESVTTNCPTPPANDLRAEINVGPNPVQEGQTVSYTVNYCNDGPDPSPAAGLEFNYDNNSLYFLGVSGQVPDNNYTDDAGTISFPTSPTLNPAACGTFTLSFTALADGITKAETLFAQSIGGSLTTAIDATPQNNYADVVLTINEPPVPPMPADGDKLLLTSFTNTLGETVTYSIEYDNTDSAEIHTVDLTDSYNATDLTFVTANITPTTATPGTITWDNVTVPAGQTLTLDVVFTLARVLDPAYVLTNNAVWNAEYGSACNIVPDNNLSNNSSAIPYTITGPTPPVCGNGIVETGEVCDDGNTVDDDACSNLCVENICGDGIVNNGEECDDGNAINTDACDNMCVSAVCGDGIVNNGEACDDGNAVDDDACNNLCVVNVCGDGVVNNGEACDDGNAVNDDACNNLCIVNYCGDGTVNNGEACDDGNTVDDDACNNACITNYCGDGIVNNGEACDDGNAVDDDACSNTCAAAGCGDGIVNNGEACDDGNAVDDDACSNLCVVNVCGDGIVNNGEACDDGNAVDDDACSNLCVNNYCGDGVVNNGEACDDGNAVDDDACNNLCVVNVCGDGVVNNGEACDDGNAVNDDACSNLCVIAVCGDGAINNGEACDDGNTVNDDACSNLCVVAVCGDGAVNNGEACDDGNAVDDDACNNLCVVNVCGDGIVNNGEACDDGNAVDDDACSNTCAAASCGDGVVNNGEACDDGNTIDNDACSNLCVVNVCGDGVVNNGEACDDGNAVDDDACSNTCVTNYCGDGVVNNGEACDDGNTVDDDACSNTCVVAICGDGTVNNGEACDDGNTVNDDACSNMCIVAVCGDGIVNNGEACDDGNAVDDDLCSNSCVLAVCGDGVVNNGEACDDGNAVNDDTCNNSCVINICGDGVVNNGEACDDGNAVDDDACNNSCVANYCGDGIVNNGEACDDGNTVDDDACNNTCSPAGCGDGVVNNGEACDDGNTVNDDACSNLCVVAFCGDGSVNNGEACDDGNAVDDDGCNNACVPAFCGDGIVNNGEACDDGNAVDDDGCNNSCIANICGDGILNNGEACDDGNTVNDDACNNLCVINICGDGSVNNGEACDDGNTVNDDTCSNLCVTNYCGDATVNNGEACDDGNTVDDDACNNLCVANYCGDGAVNNGEACDDGNAVDDDACSNTCAPAGCGDGIVNNGEVCDDGNTVDDDACSNLCVDNYCGDGVVNNGEACDDGNAVDDDACSNLCVDNYCGDGVVNNGEACDDGNSVDDDSCTNGCILTICGDGIINNGEACDDGNAVNDDACSNTCVVAICGDGVVNNGEACDDGNAVDDDACSNTCVVAICGDGVVNNGDECDDANAVDDDACNNACVANYCGDGIVNNGEACDDGNTVDDDACNNTCSPAGCGDGVVNNGEACDDGNAVDDDACSNTCVAAGCGDGVVNNGEACDDGNAVDDDACSNTCVAAFCGDGVVNNGEACDDGNAVDDDTCNNSCVLNVCGDGVVNNGEACDDGNAVDDDACNNVCVANYCGDGIVNNGEACDDGNTVDDDACNNTCSPAGCGDGVVNNGEACDDGNAVDDDACSNTCVAAGCGDGVVNNGEACDDGNAVDDDACSNTCVAAFCGDGVVNNGEACDDGNAVDDDTCNNSCVLNVCGDGVVNNGEACDDGNAVDDDACNNVCVANYCGDGIVNNGEACDDGNTVDDDACNNTCSPAGCGDGVVNNGEACDDGNAVDDDACSNVCVANYCGDGIVNNGEACDDGNTVDDDACNNTCSPAGCGDGVVNNGEACDDGNAVDDDACSNTCVAAGCGDGVVNNGEACDDGNAVDDDACSNTCVAAFCGDGVVNNGEACDDGNAVDDDTCNNSCVLNVCGDGVVNNGEACDDGNAVDDDACNNVCVANYCGDGIVNNGEACDDGNTVDDDACNNTCSPAGCGDGVVNNGEACDDGNAVDDDACSNTCVAAFCGDGVVNNGEACDDGNAVDDDTCNNSCVLNVCGDGVVNNGEVCDDGNAVDDDACSNVCVANYCGDGVVNNGEVCDDGNAVDDDTCNNSCVLNVCGDGVVNNGEACDDGNAVDDDACSNVCVANYCGDGIVNNGEACDDGNTVDDDACNNSCLETFCGDDILQSPNSNGQYEVCEPNIDSNCAPGICAFVFSFSYCGDGILQDTLPFPVDYLYYGGASPEQCDPFDASQTNRGAGGCSRSCYPLAAPDPLCGDGTLDTGEECDDGNNTSNDGCDSLCGIEICGDGNLDVGEICDDGNISNNDGCDSLCGPEIFETSINKSLLTTGTITKGDIITYQIEIYNESGSNWTGQNVVVTDYLGTGLVFSGTVSISGSGLVTGSTTNPDGSVEWMVNDFAIGGTVMITYDVEISLTAPDAVENVVTIDPPVGTGNNPPETIPLLSGDCDTSMDYDPIGGIFAVSGTNNIDCIEISLEGVCGNGITEPGEECDDGNTDDTDACTNGCTAAVCGDGITGPGEECDDGNTDDTDACTNGCTAAVCGDGITGPGEECDDGNTDDTDACTNGCTAAVCGDGITGPGEECDDGNTDDTDACTNGCTAAVCGDGITGPGEECDDGNTDDTDACTNGCTAAVCGDGITGPGEECDDGNTDDTDACTNGCTAAVCGDGITGPGEECDDGNTNEFDGCLSACVTQLCEVNGYVYLDVNYSQSFDSGDIAEGAITVTLSDGSTAETDSGGYYEFTGLDCEVDYVVGYDNIDTDIQGEADSAQNEDGSQSIDPVATVTGSTIPQVEFDPDYVSNDNNFGLIELCEINGYVYFDSNYSQTFDAGDIADDNVSLTLSNGDTTTTDVSGYYEFTNLECNTDYTVGYDDGTTSIGSPDSDQSEDGTQDGGVVTTGDVPQIEFVVDLVSNDNNFGLVEYCSIGGVIYTDTANDNTYTPGTDLPQEGVAVTLSLNGVDQVTVQTLANGIYEFTGLLCDEEYLVSYDDTTATYKADSAQDEGGVIQSTNPTADVTSSYAGSGEFNAAVSDFTSEENNFGLVEYNLAITKVFDHNEDQGGTSYPLTNSSGANVVEDGDKVFYTLTFSNSGPTTATGVEARDQYPTTLSNFTLESQSGPTTLSMTTSGTEMIFAVGSMASGDSYTLLISADVTGNHDEVVTNGATIYTEDGPSDPIETTFTDNESEDEVTIISCGVDGVVYVDVANNNVVDLVDLKLDGIAVTVSQTDPNGNTNTTLGTSGGGTYAVGGLSCRHPVVVSYVETTDYVPDSSQVHETEQQPNTQTLTVIPSNLDGDDTIVAVYEDHYVSEDNNFGLIGYGLDISKSFVSNTFAGVDYDLTEVIGGTTYQVVESGDTVIYELNFANMGPTVATGVRALDIMPPSLTYVSAVIDGGSSTDSNVSITYNSGTNTVDMYVAEIQPGAAYRVVVETIVSGVSDDFVVNNASIYTNLGPSDPVENEFDPEDVADNVDDEIIVVQHCVTDGRVYLDIANNDVYDAGTDVVQIGQEVTLTSIHETFVATTDANGYFEFEEHSCRYNVGLEYVNTTSYIEDSAQYEYATINDVATPLDTSIPVATYSPTDRASLENNFGLVLYDLAITKLVDGTGAIEVYNRSNVVFTLELTNTGPTTAYNVLVSDVYGPFVTPFMDTLQGAEAGWSVNLSSATNTIELMIPELVSGETHTVEYIANIEDPVNTQREYTWNNVAIYVGVATTDPIEGSVKNPPEFTNNEDDVAITLIPVAEGNPDFCGDGEVNQTREECDLGVENGQLGSLCSAVCKIVFETEEHEAPEHLDFVSIVDPYTCGGNDIVGAISSSDLDNTEVAVVVSCGDEVTRFTPELDSAGGYIIPVSYKLDSANYIGEGECVVVSTATLGELSDERTFTTDITLDCGCGDGRVLGDEVCEEDSQCGGGESCQACGCVETVREVIPEYVRPTFWAGMGTRDSWDDLLLQEGLRTYAQNPYIDTEAPAYAHVAPATADLDYWFNRMPIQYQSADMYFVYNGLGIAIPVHSLADVTNPYDVVDADYLEAAKNGGVHMIGTSLPGDSDLNPVAITAHSAALTSEEAEFPAPFKTLVLGQEGDLVKVYQKEDGEYIEYQYRVIEVVKDVDPSDMSLFEKYEGQDVVIAASCFSEGLIGSLDGRAVVVAELVKEIIITVPSSIQDMIDQYVAKADDVILLALLEKVEIMAVSLDAYDITTAKRNILKAVLEYLAVAIEQQLEGK